MFDGLFLDDCKEERSVEFGRIVYLLVRERFILVNYDIELMRKVLFFGFLKKVFNKEVIG